MSTTENNHTLNEAVARENANEVQRLIPVSDPKCRKSWALQYSIARHTECVNLLFDMSNPKIALHQLIDNGLGRTILNIWD